MSSSCSNNDDKSAVIGTWKLVTWTADVPFDFDSKMTSNFLDKTACNVNETLAFDKKGIVTSNDTFNPEITISLKDGTSDVYFVEEICGEGSISFATSYTLVDKMTIGINGALGSVENKELTFVYSGGIKIYNEALTDVIDLKDLTLIYLKK